MITILKNGHVYAPQDLGIKDVLMVGRTIAHIADRIDPAPSLGDVVVVDVSGCSVVPGFIDQHVHLLGGGGEGGYSTRTPEVLLSDLTTAGVTTVVGTLGTDNVTRSLESLLAKARGLEEEGISAWMYTGAYNVPSPTLTGNVRSDVILIDKVVGGKVAISDHRSAQPTKQEIARLAAECRVGGLLSGKAGVVHFHVGEGREMLDMLFELIAETGIPATQFTPTHLNKNKELLAEGIRFAKMGGMLDITTSTPTIAPKRIQPPEAILMCLNAGLSIDRITMSSDGNGSMPVFDAQGRLTGLIAASPKSLFNAVRNIVKAGTLPLGEAIKPVTVNPATSLKLPNKGRIEAGFDADVLVLDDDLRVAHLFAKGRHMVNGDVLIKGVFEK